MCVRLHITSVLVAQPPTPVGGMVTAVLDDTCGNLIQLVSAE